MARESTWPWGTARDETWHRAGFHSMDLTGAPSSLLGLLAENVQSAHEAGGKYPEKVIAFFFAELLSALLRFRHHLLCASFLSAYSY